MYFLKCISKVWSEIKQKHKMLKHYVKVTTEDKFSLSFEVFEIIINVYS